MPHQRTHEGEQKQQQRRDARRYILTYSFMDRELAETVCTITSDMVKNILKTRYDSVYPYIYTVEKGEVLVDSRGRGSFQEVKR